MEAMVRGSTSFTFTPPMDTAPEVGSQNRAARLARVDLPPPEGPTRAAVSPAPMVREMFSRAFFVPS